LIAELAGSEDSGSSEGSQREKAGAIVSSHRVVRLGGVDEIEKVVVIRVGGLMLFRQRLFPDCGSIQVVDHFPDTGGLNDISELWVPASGADLVDLRRAGENFESRIDPCGVDRIQSAFW
jgi:hypothetical protein